MSDSTAMYTPCAACNRPIKGNCVFVSEAAFHPECWHAPVCPDCTAAREQNAALRQQLADAQAQNAKLRDALRWTVNAMCGCSKADGGPLRPGEYEAAVESGKAALQEAPCQR